MGATEFVIELLALKGEIKGVSSELCYCYGNNSCQQRVFNSLHNDGAIL